MCDLSANQPELPGAARTAAERAEALLDLAYQQLELLLQDPKTPPSVRMKAIQYVIERAATQPPQKNVSTQPEPLPDPVVKQPAENRPNLHNSAQPQPGRNSPCPCGSRKKYKQCCLNRATFAAAA